MFIIQNFEIENIIRLVKIDLSDDEKSKIPGQLKRVFEYFTFIDEIQITNDFSGFYPIDEINMMRKDIIETSLLKNEVLKNVPLKSDNFILVPKVIKK